MQAMKAIVETILDISALDIYINNTATISPIMGQKAGEECV